MEHCTAYTVHCTAGVANLSRAKYGPFQKNDGPFNFHEGQKKSSKKFAMKKDLNIFDFLAHLP